MVSLPSTNFTGWDWLIVASYLLVALAVGLLVRRYATDMTAYIGAGRGVGTWLGVATLTGTELGLVTVMYSAEMGFLGGFAAFHIALLAGIVTLLVGLTGFIVVPLRRLRVLTIPEFYERRYGRRTRILGGVVLALGGILNMGLFLKVGSIFVVAITGLSHESWALPAVMTILLALVLAYTVLGGMISVIITDYLQFVLLSFGLLLTSLLAIGHLGWGTIFETIGELRGPAGFDPLAAEGDFGLSYVAWMALLGLISCAVWPTAVARALAMESPASVRHQYIWSSISFLIRFLIPQFLGICALVYLVTEAPQLLPLWGLGDPSASVPEEEQLSALYAMPWFLGQLLPAGLIGLITAALLAAFMSTHDSYLLSWSSVLTQDVVAPLRGRPLSSAARVRLTRIFIVLVGLYVWVWGLWYEGTDAVWNYMAITGAIYFTGAVPLLVGGLYWRRASSTGAVCALVCGCSAVFGLEPLRLWVGEHVLALAGVAEPRESAERMLTAARVGLASIGLTSVAFIAGSLLFPDRRPEEEE